MQKKLLFPIRVDSLPQTSKHVIDRSCSTSANNSWLRFAMFDMKGVPLL